MAFHGKSGKFMCGGSLVSCFNEFVQPFFYCGEVSFVCNVGEGLWFIAHHEVKRGFSGGRVGLDVVNKFCHRGLVCPFRRVRSAKYPKVGFKFLVYPFSFSISFRVVYRRYGEFISKYSSKFPLELGCKLWSSIRDDFVEKSKSGVEFSKNNSCDSFGSDGFLCGT